MHTSFTTIVKEYLGLVYYFTRKLCSSQEDVDDIVSETFLKAFTAYTKASFKDSQAIKSWLLAICHNTIRSRYRRRRPFIMIDDSELTAIPDPKIESTLDQMIKQEELETIQQAIQTLPTVEQELIHLRIYEDISFKHISTIFETSESAIKMKFYRTLSKLKEAII